MGLENKIEHESFGMISFVKTQSSGHVSLFGSSIQHRHFVTMRISKAVMFRDLNHDWFHPEKVILEVEMSMTQFADAISSFNTSGVPCTLKIANGKKMKEPEFINKRIEVDNEFEEKMKEIASKNNEYFQKIGSILQKKSIGKHDREEILKQLDLLNMQIERNLPYMKECFTKQMDQTVLEAKNEFSAFVEDKINHLGLKDFKKELKLLTEKTLDGEETGSERT